MGFWEILKVFLKSFGDLGFFGEVLGEAENLNFGFLESLRTGELD